MKFDSTKQFDNEFKSLLPEYRRSFLALIPAFNTACENYIKNAGVPWPKRLRVSQLTDFSGIWEMTWSFSGPDGRATFEFVDIDGETGVRWRRIGGHGIYRNP